MYCYKCGTELNERNYCPKCGADVKVYRQVIFASNHFYNEGLERAKVHDLSGAVTSLRQSVRLYKYNIDARNLLGLVYYYIGETSAALSEWVISENLQPEKNLASAYMDDIQRDRNRLENLRQAIIKYNRALDYCHQGAYDLAEIQLKKVLQLNRRFLRARQLLSLLYLSNSDYARALKQLKQCQKIDQNNTTTLLYLRELSEQPVPDDAEPVKRTGSEVSAESVKFRDGNETIIQPGVGFNPQIDQPRRIPSVIINIGLGLLIGAAIVGLFVLPVRVQSVRSEASAKYKELADQLNTVNATVSEQTQQITTLTTSNDSLSKELESYKSSTGAISANDALLKAAAAYVKNPEDTDSIARAFADIDYENVKDTVSDEYKSLYEQLLSLVRVDIEDKFYSEGKDYYDNKYYENAVTSLVNAVKYSSSVDDTYDDALYYLADSYYQVYLTADSTDQSKYEDYLTSAQKYFNAASEVADSEYADSAKTKLQEIKTLKTQKGITTDGSDETVTTSDGTADTTAASDTGDTTTDQTANDNTDEVAADQAAAAAQVNQNQTTDQTTADQTAADQAAADQAAADQAAADQAAADQAAADQAAAAQAAAAQAAAAQAAAAQAAAAQAAEQ